MWELNSLPIFFLGANNISGYVSRFADCFDSGRDWQVWVMKGGPGSGKSTFMKKAADRLQKTGHSLYVAPCPADPDSLDAVVSDSRRLMILDGTAPHPMEPPLPGVVGRIVDTGRFWQEKKLLENKEKIAALAAENSRLHTRAAGYTAAAAAIIGEGAAFAADATDTTKAAAFAKALAAKYLPKKGDGAKEQVRFLSGITPAGVTYYRSTVEKTCQNVVEIWDEQGAAAGIILSVLRQEAINRGLHFISCRCPLRPLDKTDHLLFPQLNLAFCSVNRYLGGSESVRRIHAQRFTDADAMRRHHHRLAWGRKAAKELLGCAAGLLADAKSVHDLLESYYSSAMDYPALDDYCQTLLSEI